MDNEQLAVAVVTESLSVGTLLRRCRESKNIPVEEASEATKIGKTYLRAMEADRPQDLPSPAYLKGFLRTYAIYLGLEPEELFRLLSNQNSCQSLDAQPSAKTSSKSTAFNWQRFMLPAVLLVALIITALVITPSSPERPRLDARPQPAPIVPLTPVAAVQSVRSSTSSPLPVEQQAERPEESPELSAVPPKPHDGFLARMKVTRNSSLSVIIDDAVPQGYALTSGDLIEWKAARTIALDLSDSDSVEIELNGTALKLQPSQGKSAYIVLDANGIRR